MKNKFALASFIFGIVGLALFLSITFLRFRIDSVSGGAFYFFLLLLISILAIIFGIMGIKKSKEKRSSFFALTGLTLGTITMTFLILHLIIAIGLVRVV
ncbi:MAG: hypothetical protein QXP53_02600 [Candidatus Pacearchaeota archaeon]